MVRFVSKASGFTLIEVLAVVAIIGLLAALALPSYKKFRARARQTEPKSLLSGVFAAQKAFKAEYGAYATNISYGGYAPDGVWTGTVPFFYAGIGNNVHYGLEVAEWTGAVPSFINLVPYGFSSYVPGTFPDQWMPQASLCDAVRSGQVATFEEYRNGAFGVEYLAQTTESAFQSISVGCPLDNILFANPATWGLLDIWTINQDRALKNEQSAL